MSVRAEKRRVFQERVAVMRECLAAKQQPARLALRSQPELREAMLQMVEDCRAFLLRRTGTQQSYNFYPFPGECDAHPFVSRRSARETQEDDI